MTARTCHIAVSRFQPATDAKPYLQRFAVPYDDSTSILDALEYIKSHLDSSLTYRWSCRMAICGSCGVMVNGTPKLGCKTFVRDYFNQRADGAPPGGAKANTEAAPLEITPLAHFSVERDLVVNMDEFLTHLEAVQPYLIDGSTPPTDATAKPTVNQQTPNQMARYKQFANCINCGLCYAACPQFGLNPEFVGPAAIALAHRYNLDSRDQGKAQRMAVLNSRNGVWPCTFVGFCSEVCPQGVDPAAAVNQNKVESAKSMLIQLFKGGAIGGAGS